MKILSLSPGQCIHVVLLGLSPPRFKCRESTCYGLPVVSYPWGVEIQCTPHCFMLLKPEISAGSGEALGLPNYNCGRLYLYL